MDEAPEKDIAGPRPEWAMAVVASLAGAISLLERGGRKAAGSDRMFEMMLDDYRKALEDARTALGATTDVEPSSDDETAPKP